MRITSGIHQRSSRARPPTRAASRASRAAPGSAVPNQQVGEQRQPVRHPVQRALRPEVLDSPLRNGDARGVGSAPSVENQHPLPVVGEAVPIAQVLRLAHGLRHGRDVVAHLMRDRGIGQRRGEAVRMVDLPGQPDRVATARQRLVVVAQEQPGVRGPGPRMRGQMQADAQRARASAQVDDTLEVVGGLHEATPAERGLRRRRSARARSGPSRPRPWSVPGSPPRIRRRRVPGPGATSRVR